MQRITVEEIRVVKSKPDAAKKWELVALVSEGTEFTSFDLAIKEVGIGGVIEFEPAFKDGKINISKGWKIISKGTAPVVASPSAPAPAINGTQTSPEEWKEKQRIERASFEGQTAFKGIIELAATDHFQLLRQRNDVFKEKLDFVLDMALDWAEKRLAPTLQDMGDRMPHLPLDEDKGEFKNVGEFLAAMLAKGLSRTQTVDELVRLKLIKDESELPRLNLVDAWVALGDSIVPAQ